MAGFPVHAPSASIKRSACRSATACASLSAAVCVRIGRSTTKVWVSRLKALCASSLPFFDCPTCGAPCPLRACPTISCLAVGSHPRTVILSTCPIVVSLGRNSCSVTPHSSSIAFPLAFGASQCSVLSRSEEHTSELQSRPHLVCRLLL